MYAISESVSSDTLISDFQFEDEEIDGIRATLIIIFSQCKGEEILVVIQEGDDYWVFFQGQ